MLILRVVTNPQGEPFLKLGSKYEPPRSKSLPEVFEDLKVSISQEMTPAQLKKLLKEKFSSFSGPMVNHLMSLAESCGVSTAVASFSEDILFKIGKSYGYVTVDQANDDQLFVDFHAYNFNGIINSKEFPTFNEAVDEFYSKIEFQKSKKAVIQQEKDAQSKIEAIRKEQNNRIAGLEAIIELYLERARTIDAEPKKVQDAIVVIKAALDAGMDWTNLELIMNEEKKKGNPTALLMNKLKLEKNIVTLSMERIDCDEPVLVDIDVTMTPHANATKYYELRKAAMDKLARTKDAMSKALKSAEKKIRQDLKQSVSKAKRQQTFSKRKVLWFEKFNWFISSDSFLVIAGRDMQQNELLVKRYLKEGDAYVHADMHGASSVIVKGRRIEDTENVAPSFLPIPPRTLTEAGTMSLCNSRAWEAKILTSAWWVYASQVSKTAPSGEYLPTGSFMIRGKKNFLPPSQLIYGFGFMFVLNDEAKEKQKIERMTRDKQLAEGLVGLKSLDKYMSLLEIDVSEPVEEINVTTNMPKPKQIQPEKKSKKKTAEFSSEEKKNSSILRGSKSKQKKIAKKYADQDDEERQLRMTLLASKKKVEEPKPQRQKAPRAPANNTVRSNENTPQPVLVATTDDEDDEKIQAEDELGVIDALAGNLRDNFENVKYAIPVAGPISALQNYSFRLKLSPGSLKRGKAVQQALSILLSDTRELDIFTWSHLRDEENRPDAQSVLKQVREMIRAIPDADLNQTMLGHVKIMATSKELQKSKKDLFKQKKK